MNSNSEQLEIFIPRSILAEFYSASSHVIIAASDRQFFQQTISLDGQIQVYEFQVKTASSPAIIKPLKDIGESNTENLSEIKLAPNFCLGMVTFSQAGKQELSTLIDWWSQRCKNESISPVIELDRTEPTALQRDFWREMYSKMEAQNQAIALRIVNLQKQYLALRKIHEETQNAFATVEDYLSQAKLPPIQLAFDSQIGKKIAEPREINDSNSLVLKQLLPVSSRGLAAIELHVAQQYPKAVGCLKVSLKACEDTAEYVTWKVPYSHLSQGWFSLDLPQIDLHRQRDVELIVEWESILGPAPSLSLTKRQSILEAKAHNDRITLNHSLAVRIWQGLPGTRKVTSPYLIVTSDRDRSPQPELGDLGQRAMAQVREVTPNLASDDFAHIQVFNDGAKIMTHPRADGMPTIAMLPYCFPPTANRLTAEVITEHQAAGIIEYAIAIIKPSTKPNIAFKADVALGFSKWIPVEPNTPRKISVDLASPVSEHCHIAIATKLAPGHSTDFAWANWVGFQSSHTEQKANLQNKSIQQRKDIKKAAQATQLSQPNLADKPSIDTATNIELSQIKFRDVSLSSPRSKFDKVQLVENGDKIQVHPTADVDTIAVLSDAIAPGTVVVKSTVCTENEDASVIEYAIAAIANDDDTIARLAIASPTSALGFSNWHRVKANTPKVLKLNFEKPLKDTCHLILATRLPKNSHQSNAWARWFDIEYYA